MEKGWCPFYMDECQDRCVFYRRGVRIFDGNDKPVPVEECAINVAVDCLENLVGRNIGLQKEMNLVRNATEDVSRIFKIAITRSEQNKINDSDIEEIT